MRIQTPVGLVLLIALLLGVFASFEVVAAATPGPVVAWGSSWSGQLNIPADLSGATAIAAGPTHNLAIKADGTVVGWGSNNYGQLDIPAGLSGVTAVAAGSHSLALKADGTVVAWGGGDNWYGQLNVPAGLSGVKAIAAGDYHSLAVKADGTVVGWGFNGRGQLNIPAGLSGVTAIATGSSHSLALKADGTVVGWGSNDFGALNIPAGLSGLTAIVAGPFHYLGLKGDGTVVGWGSDWYGETSAPAGLSGVTAIATGNFHSLAVKADGTVVGWGSNMYGQLNIPAGLSGVTAIAARGFHSLAIIGQPSDTTPPSISAAVDVVTNATSPAGASVSFAVTATDAHDPNPVVTCAPPSGSLFPIGTTTVTCTATDAAGNSASKSFAVTVKGAAQQLTDVITLAQSFNLQQGISNSLDAKLQNALDSLEAANAGATLSACSKLGAFVNEVQAQAGSGELTASQAEQLISAANQIKATLACA